MEDTNFKSPPVGKRSSGYPSEIEVREVLRLVLKGKDRKRMASKLTEITGLTVTERMLNDWCSPSREGLRFPLSLARAVCEVTETEDLAFIAMPENLRASAEIGGRVLNAHELLRKIADQAEALARKGSKRRK